MTETTFEIILERITQSFIAFAFLFFAPVSRYPARHTLRHTNRLEHCVNHNEQENRQQNKEIQRKIHTIWRIEKHHVAHIVVSCHRNPDGRSEQSNNPE